MKKIFTFFAALVCAAQMMAVTTQEVCGRFDGNLNIGGALYSNKSVFLLPGAVKNTVTFVLPDFKYQAGKLGNIVLSNIPMLESGMLVLEDATLYLDSISERATITVINGLEDEGYVYNSIVSPSAAQVILSIAAPSLPEPIFVLFQGEAVRTNNYALTNGGFEGEWTNNEPAGWHSFGSATGLMVDFVKENTFQFVASNEVRPGSEGTQSALVSSNMVFGVKANGNITNGQMNAGSMTADDAAGNYNFSDPTNEGFNTPLQGRPDSIVFWTKYQPADLDPNNEVNKARVSAVLTTAARYQDPEGEGDYNAVKLASAVANYAATPSLGWQRIAVPFAYELANLDKQPAYILTTFTTNMLPGGGSSYSTGSSLSKRNVLDSVYVDDVELVYNKELAAFTKGAQTLDFADKKAVSEDNYCDDCAKFAALGDGISAQTFIAFDATHKCIFVYVIADDYAQSGAYNLYRVEFADSQTGDLDPTEAIDDILEENVPCTKILRDGQLYILYNGTMYNVHGQVVK